MGESRLDDLAGSRCGYRQAVKVPLANCCGGSGTLYAGADGEGPEVDEHEEKAEKPGAGVYDEESFCIGEMAAQEDPGEHRHPDPGPCDDADEGCKTEDQQAGVCGEDPAGKLEDSNCFTERMAAAVNDKDPDYC